MTAPAAPGPERAAMLQAAGQFDLDPVDARLVSATSRLIWHLPADRIALTITRPGSKTAAVVDAEAAAVDAATAAGVRTPALLASPISLPDDQFALAFRWIDGRPLAAADWPPASAEAAKLAGARPDALRALSWPASWPDPSWKEVLGSHLFSELSEHVLCAEETLRDLLSSNNLVLCHGDLQPANILVDIHRDPWLIDLEYACLAPFEWDPAKLVVLSSRFGDPLAIDRCLGAWPELDRTRLRSCVLVQEAQIVAWLTQMALSGAHGAADESRERAGGLREAARRWRHLS